jgi:hypothetical protein
MNPGLIGGLGATELMLARDNETPARRSGMVGSSSKLSTSSTSSATHASRSARR